MTIHEHLDGTISVRYGPHVVGRYDGEGNAELAKNRAPWKRRIRGSPGKPKAGFPPLPQLPWKSRQRREIPTFPPLRRRLVPPKTETTQTPFGKPKGNGGSMIRLKPDRSRVNKTGQIDKLRTELRASEIQTRTTPRHASRRGFPCASSTGIPPFAYTGEYPIPLPIRPQSLAGDHCEPLSPN